MRKKLEFVSHGQPYQLEIPAVMGIINCTPDSFLSESRYQLDMQNKIQQWIAMGVDILDVGGQSTRPGAEYIDADTEWSRVEPVILWIRNTFPQQILSIDTFHPEVARKALMLGVHIINDVSAGQWVDGMQEVINAFEAPYILMHAQGNPKTMQANPTYANVVHDIIFFFQNKIEAILESKPNAQLWIDPGFGFGKHFEHNQTLLQNLNELSVLNYPILAGLSRKKMIQTTLNVSAENAQLGSTLAHLLAVVKGASIIRTHDVEACITLKKIFNTYN